MVIANDHPYRLRHGVIDASVFRSRTPHLRKQPLLRIRFCPNTAAQAPRPNPATYSPQNPSISRLCPEYSARLYIPRTLPIVWFRAFSTISAG